MDIGRGLDIQFSPAASAQLGMNPGHDGQRNFFRRFRADIQTDRPKHPIGYLCSFTAQVLQ